MISAYEKESGPKEVLVNHPLLNYCAKLEEKGLLPIALDQVFEAEIERSTSRSQRIEFDRLLQSLLALSCHLLIPLFHEGELLGFITARAPTPPEPWGNNWALLQIIYPYFSQVAQTLKSLEVYEKSREKERLATIGEMAAGLAHEIRNPLGAIKGAAQFLDPSLDRPESRFLQVIIEEVDRLNGVVTQFLDYSKPQTLQKQRVDLNELVKRTVDFLKAGVSDRVHFEILPAESGAILMASPEQLKQVLMNFIQNSLKAVEGRSTGKIVVSVLKSIDLDKINLVVEDNGTGIKDEHLNRLFIPFFTTSPSGTGLGLSICQKIIEAHRGRIDVVSEPGKFARFIVTLPSAPC